MMIFVYYHIDNPSFTDDDDADSDDGATVAVAVNAAVVSLSNTE